MARHLNEICRRRLRPGPKSLLEMEHHNDDQVEKVPHLKWATIQVFKVFRLGSQSMATSVRPLENSGACSTSKSLDQYYLPSSGLACRRSPELYLAPNDLTGVAY